MSPPSTLSIFWQRLAAIRELRFEARSGQGEGGWNGEGQGSVVVETVDDDTMLFHEEGHWTTDAGKGIRFTNVYRWTVLPSTDTLRLEHLRFGPKQPVYLFDLKQTEHDHDTWQSIDPHVCREDSYTAELKFGADGITLHWTIVGPKKNESVCYFYG